MFATGCQTVTLKQSSFLRGATWRGQVYRACQRGYWRASKRWCKALQPEAVDKALLRFANNEAGLRPVDVYGGPNGAFAQLQQLATWFQVHACPPLWKSGANLSSASFQRRCGPLPL